MEIFGHGETEAACQSFQHMCHGQNLTAYMQSLMSQLLTVNALTFLCQRELSNNFCQAHSSSSSGNCNSNTLKKTKWEQETPKQAYGMSAISLSLIHIDEGKAFPVYTMKAYWGNKGTAPPIANPGVRCS
jgi:hypothetical protein